MEEAELLGIARSTSGDPGPRCVNCAHYKLIEPDPVLIFGKPKHRCTKVVDLVTGGAIETDCYAMRHIRGECGPDATLFEDASAETEESATPILSAVGRGVGRALKALLVGVAVTVLILLAILALLFWVYEKERPRPRFIKSGDILQTREVSVTDGSRRITARTRLLAKDDGSVWQFEASPGVWKDCGDDCEKALRKSVGR